MTAVVCYSGGHSSALVAVEAVRKYGRESVILLNHDISSKVEHADIKRFKAEVAEYLGLPITYANAPDFETMTPLEVARGKGAFQVGNGQTFCTSYLKTEPFKTWLKENYPVPDSERERTWQERWYEATHPDEPMNEDIEILYGFDTEERGRIRRRSQLLGVDGYYTDFPLALWPRTIEKTEDIGIPRPITYKLFKHANCIGCLKAGRQHWYCVFCLRPDIWEDAKAAEEEIGYSIIKGVYLAELEAKFIEMRDEKGICPTDKGDANRFWAHVNAALPGAIDMFPCECSI